MMLNVEFPPFVPLLPPAVAPAPLLPTVIVYEVPGITAKPEPVIKPPAPPPPPPLSPDALPPPPAPPATTKYSTDVTP
jgi:hypothetical protein